MPKASARAVATASSRAFEAFACLPAAFLVLDAAGLVQEANLAACQLFGQPHPEGLAWNELLRRRGVEPPWGGAPLADARVSRAGALAMGDGRSFHCTAAPLPSGGHAVLLHEVTGYVNDAEQAFTDPLTGLDNRTAFQRALSAGLAASRRSGEPLAVLCLDLDRFKPVNDTLGHPVGDLLLQKVAQRLRSVLREGDVVARLGGDEFAILLPGAADPHAAKALASRIVDILGRTYVVGGHMLNIGVSVGVALSPQDGSDPDQLLKHADLALYRAKAEGRSTFRFFELAMDERMQARRLLEIDLRRALALREFTLAYQPQVAIGSREVTGFEALLRWTHPARGEVSPPEFIPLAEEIGIINGIGEWVLRTACREAAGWPEPLSIAVNVSAVQFRSGKLADLVVSALAQTGLDPKRLEIEITEGALLDDTDNVLATLNRLGELGVRISMDDFGTGYSSLSYLQKFPFDKIKIDQSFVRGPGAHESAGAIVRAISSLGASLGMRTIAEGVETEEQLARIQSEGCMEVQGYLTGRPMPAESIPALLRWSPIPETEVRA